MSSLDPQQQNQVHQSLEMEFKEWCSGLSLTVTDRMLMQFRDYYTLLVDWNERMNLTAITQPQDVYLKHFYDSLIVSSLPAFQTQGTLLDVGAGAGFPSLPLRIAFPDLNVTILDSLQKRILFLNTVAKHLEIDPTVSTIHGRAEDYGHQARYREAFDLVTARAVARLPVLSEFCLPYVKVGGMFFALKGPDAEDEVKEAKSAIAQLGGEIQDIRSTHLPNEGGSRVIVCIRKVKKTAKQFPRKPGVPQKRPLG